LVVSLVGEGDREIDALVDEIADELYELKATEKRYLWRALDGVAYASRSFAYAKDSCMPDDIADVGRYLQSARDWLEMAARSGEIPEEKEEKYRGLLEKLDDLERLMREAIREICSCRPLKPRG
jgi:hypothetical protein